MKKNSLLDAIKFEESLGYLYRPDGSFIHSSIAKPADVIFHFKKKEELNETPVKKNSKG